MITGKMTTLARPYAMAAFEQAMATNALSSWDDMLVAAAQIARTPSIQQLTMRPDVTPAQLADFYCDVLSKLLDTDKTNFIRLLAEYHRLAVLPDISELFKAYRAAQEKTLDVQVKSAVALDEKFKQKLAETLTRRLKRQVNLACSIDANLLGGATITAGDTVIDGSVRGKLTRMIESIL